MPKQPKLERFKTLVTHELQLWKSGLTNIVGLDEVGRGPLAGPLVVCAVILNKTTVWNLVNLINKPDTNQASSLLNNDINLQNYLTIFDSKKVSAPTRFKLREFLLGEVIEYKLTTIPVETIDQIGVGRANALAFETCLASLTTKPEHILTDYFKVATYPSTTQTNLPHGDAQSLSIAAASIIAKTYRDDLLTTAHITYPNYGFDRNKGYGTKEHIQNILTYGTCPLHRKSFLTKLFA